MKFSWGPFKNEPSNRIKLTNQYFEKVTDTKKIIDIFFQILMSDNPVTLLDFSECTNISTTGFTILTALGPLLHNQGRQLHIESGNNTDLDTRFIYNTEKKTSRKDIPFRLLKNQQSIIDTLNILETIPELKELKINNLERYNEIWSRIYELCYNANEHGENNIGAVCNGVCNKDYLTFTVFDFGKGIPKTVNSHNKTNWSTQDCINWSLTKGNSTKQSFEVPRGAGFSTTIQFINKYKGQMILCTGDTYGIIKNNNKHFQKINHNMIGTLITISIYIK